MNRKQKRILLIAGLALLLLGVGCGIYAGTYSHASPEVAAAIHAAKDPEGLTGLILLAAYATKPLSEDLAVLELHGSEDRVLNRSALEKGRAYLPAASLSEELPGGNHAQFGDYGPQKGDGVPTVSRAAQTAWAADRMEAFILGR